MRVALRDRLPLLVLPFALAPGRSRPSRSPWVKYTRSGTIDRPFSTVERCSCSSSRRCTRSLRGRSRLVRPLVPLLVGGDVHPLEPELAAAQACEAVDERRLAQTERLHLGAGELDPTLEDLEQLVVVPRLPVGRDDLVVGTVLGARHGAQATRRGSGACRRCRRRPRRRSRPRSTQRQDRQHVAVANERQPHDLAGQLVDDEDLPEEQRDRWPSRRRASASDAALDQERHADPPVRGADEAHDADLLAPGEHAHPQGVRHQHDRADQHDHRQAEQPERQRGRDRREPVEHVTVVLDLRDAGLGCT